MVNAEFDEGVDLFDDLLWSADERSFGRDVIGVEAVQGGLVFGAETGSEPGAAQGGRIASDFVTGTLAFGD